MDNKKNQAQKTKRLAIFSENEKKYLKGKRNLDIKMKSKFHKKLNVKFEALLQDLELMARSERLKIWRSSHYKSLYVCSQTNIFQHMLSNSQILYIDTIRHKRSGKKHFFWLDLSPRKYDDRFDERALQSEFLLRHIRGKTKDVFGDKLIEAYKKNLIPIEKKDAISEKELQLLLLNKMKPKSHKDMTLSEVEKEDPESAKRIKKVEKIVNMYTKKLNSRLEPLGFRMGQMSYVGS